MFAFTLFFAGFIYLPPRRLDDTMGVNKPLTNWVASRFVQRCVNLVVSANLTDTSDKLTDRYTDRQTVPDSINCIVLAPVMDIALVRALIPQSSLEMLSCAAFKLCCQNFALFCRWCFEFLLFFSHITTRKRMAAMGEAKALLVCNPVGSAQSKSRYKRNTDSNMVSEPGGYSIEFYTGRLRIEVQPLSPLYTIFDKKRYPCLYLSLWQMLPFSHT